MRRFSVYNVYLAFLSAFVVVGAAGGISKGCAISARNESIEQAESAIRLLKAAEGEEVSSVAGDFVWRAKRLQEHPEFKHLGFVELMSLAKTVSKADAEARKALDPTDHFGQLANLTALDGYGEFENLAKLYPLDEIVSGRQKSSGMITVPERVPVWQLDYWLRFYLAAGVLFCLILSLYTVVREKKHPVLQYPWHRVDAILMFLLAAPATVPLTMIYGLYRVQTSDWTDAAEKTRAALRRGWNRAYLFGFETGLLRRGPAPIVAPLRFTGPALTAGPAPTPTPPTQPTATETVNEPLWYVFDPDLFLGQTAHLQKSGVGVYPIAIRKPRQLAGWAVHASEIEAFERALRLDKEKIETEETDIERTVLVTFEATHGNVEIDTDDRDKFARPWLLTALKNISALNGDVDILYVAKDFHRSVDPDKAGGPGIVTVHHCATPAEKPERVSFNRVFGRDLEDQKGLKPAEGRGAVIRDEDGVPVAQVIGNVICTLMDGMITGQERWRHETLVAILHDAVAEALRQTGRHGDDDSAAVAWRESLGHHREKYVEISSRRSTTRKSALEKEVENQRALVIKAGKAITKALQNQRVAEKELDAFLQTTWNEEKDRLRNEFDQLTSSKYVLSVLPCDEGIEVYTRTIFVAHLGKRYRVGRFRISLYGNGGINIVNVANAQKCNNGYEHPHIKTGGAPCFGNIQESLGKLMADRQYAVVVNMLYRYLESYNPHRGVADINDWKEASNEE